MERIGACLWPVAPQVVTATPDEVHVWGFALEDASAGGPGAADVLSLDERERARRFYAPRDRMRFVAARATLRRVLARYLGEPPEALVFRYGPHGKPALEGSAPGRDLRFNLSHAGPLALLAVTAHREVGIDVEPVDPAVAQEPIAERFFSPREVAALRALPHPEQGRAFYRVWTRKEAYLKATGLGLSLALDQFDVSLAPSEPPRLLHTAWDPAEAARWRLADLDVGPAHAAALAVEGDGWRLRCWRLDARPDLRAALASSERPQ